MLRISHYATASTDSAAYIIGGWNGDYVSTIAEYKNNKWRKIGNLNEPKIYPSAIFNNGKHIVIDSRLGIPGPGALVSSRLNKGQTQIQSEYSVNTSL